MDSKWLRYFWGTAFFGWSVVLFIISVIPTTGLIIEDNRDGAFRWDYPLHLTVFIIFALLYGYWRISVNSNNIRKESIWFLLGGSLYAGFTEFIQIFVEGRSFNPTDLLLNELGVLVGILLAYFFIMKPNTKKQKSTS